MASHRGDNEDFAVYCNPIVSFYKDIVMGIMTEFVIENPWRQHTNIWPLPLICGDVLYLLGVIQR